MLLDSHMDGLISIFLYLYVPPQDTALYHVKDCDYCPWGQCRIEVGGGQYYMILYVYCGPTQHPKTGRNSQHICDIES